MNTKTIIMFVAVMVGVLAGITALLWNFGQQGARPIEDIAGEMRHTLGTGEVVVTEFSDFQCPACAGVQAPLTELLAKYEGKVKLVYRYLPLTSIHKNAMAAALAAEAASEQGKFWEMHDILFERQTEWETLADPRDKFGEYAGELEIDQDKFGSDMEREDLRQVILKDSTEAVKYQIQATPSFYVNGEKVEFPGLEEKINKYSPSE